MNAVPFTRMDRLVWVLTIAFTLFLFLFGPRFHYIEAAGSAEIDGFVRNAEAIRAGQRPYDPFRPLLYPILSAGLGELLDDTFAGARTVSSISAGLFVLLTYELGRLCFNRGIAFLAFIATLLNHNTIVHGLYVATDMTFAALTLLTLVFAVRANRQPRLTSVLLLAFAFALAYFTRYTAIALLPAVVISLIFAPATDSRKRIAANVVIFIVATTVFLLPHFALNTFLFGHPFYNETWRNLAFKLYGEGDWSYLVQTPFDGLSSVILHSPARFLTSAMREAWDLVRHGLSALGGGGAAGILFTASFLLGTCHVLISPNRERILVLSFLVAYITMVCMSFFAWVRIVLPILPLAYLLASDFLLSDDFRKAIRVGRVAVAPYLLAVAVFLLALGATTVKHIPAFIDGHPVQELDAALALQRQYGSELTVLGTTPFLDRYVEYQYYVLDDVDGRERDNVERYYDRLRATIDQTEADYVIISRLSLGGRPEGLLLAENVPSFLQPIVRDQDVVVYSAVHSADIPTSVPFTTAEDVIGAWQLGDLWALQFSENGSLRGAQAAEDLMDAPSFVGEFWFENAQLKIRFETIRGASVCAENEVGSYNVWGVRGDCLFFRVIEDACAARANGLQTGVWRWISP
jgi:4-amino-4-deoxy-L-arabinose transferase-like glycosyltransferase